VLPPKWRTESPATVDFFPNRDSEATCDTIRSAVLSRMPFFSPRRKLGVGLIAIAFVPYAVACWHANRYNWTPLNYRVDLHKGNVRAPEFLADVDGRYVLYLDVRPRKLDFQRQECLLDLELFQPEKCATIPSVVELSWTLSSDGAVVADNATLQTWRTGSYANDFTRREIGRFDARRGRRYVLDALFRSDPSELNVASPKIVAESMQDWEEFAIETQGTFVLGVAIAIAGVAVLGPFTFRKRGTTRQHSPSEPNR